MNRQPFPFYLSNDKGLVTVEFVVISFALLVMSFLVIELTTIYFTIMSAQMAAQMGARVAIVSDAAAVGTPSVNERATNGIFGTSCGDASAPCTGWSPAFECVDGGASCNAVPLARILSRMKQFLGNLEAENVTISYAYSGLGYAGGPAIPAVTVTIHDVPYNTGIIGGIIGTAHGRFTTLPTVSVTLMGEDLSRSGG